jgi:hypothetical protein
MTLEEMYDALAMLIKKHVWSGITYMLIIEINVNSKGDLVLCS